MNSPGHGSSAVTVSPAVTTLSVSAKQQFTAAVLGQSNQGVVWSLSPSVGLISPGGLYTAPSVITSAQTIAVTATSIADPTLSAAALVVLAPLVSVGLSPSSGTVSQSGTLQFTPVVTGALDTSVSWSLSPPVGSISPSGKYTAPANVNASQTVTLTATSVADPTKSSSASILLSPAVGVSLNPPATTIPVGSTVQFYVSVTGTTNPAVQWYLNPAVGSMSSGGLYSAPQSVAAPQTVTVYATSVADTSKFASATVTINPVVTVSLNVTSATLAASQSQQFLAQVSGSQNQTVSWSVVPPVGSISGSGLFTTPASISSTQIVKVIATSQADPSQSAAAIVTLQASTATTTPPPPPPPNPINLPVEVIGPDGYTVTVPVTLSAVPPGAQRLGIRIHGLRYDNQASVQVNRSGFLPINTASVNILGLGQANGGIGGGFSTLEILIDLPAGTLSAGSNSVQFRFNGTDGRVSGFRILDFNFVAGSSSAPLLAAGSFVYEDPTYWQPPSTLASDIAAGQLLWRTASLTVPVPGGSPAVQPILAHCMDCHAQDGRDLKYFNYSNNSIRARSLFHGLTAAQGDQIASYIRSLPITAPPNGRPWNPPYQPGPGLDSQPVANWSAGAGLDAVLSSDAAMLPYLAPNGSTAGWAANQYLNARELPIALQLPDWNSWLPAIHPMDAYGSAFTTSTFNTTYAAIRASLTPGDPASYANNSYLFPTWHTAAFTTFLGPLSLTATSWDAQSRQSLFSAALWMMVKSWEINQEYGLEGMPSVIFGPKADARGWYSVAAFQVSPLQLHIPSGPGLGNGSDLTAAYLGYIWYHTQLILNDGNGSATGQNPIDWNYTQGRVLGIAGPNAPSAMLEFVWLIKALQEMTQLGVGPDQGPSGFEPTEMPPVILVHPNWEVNWSNTPTGTRTALTQAFVQAYFNQVQTYTLAQYNAGIGSEGAPWASPTENPRNDDMLTIFGGQIWSMLPRLRSIGVSPSLTYAISAWAQTLWPAGDWAFNNGATCTDLSVCTSD